MVGLLFPSRFKPKNGKIVMNKPFNLWLRDEIANQGHTQREVAKKAQIHILTLSKYISGRIQPTKKIVQQIIETLELIKEEQKKRKYE